ncbi:MAG: HAD family phosphatase [Eubacterium sp.]|nr:HAD family phosphatase [Eubacterium sp.]
MHPTINDFENIKGAIFDIDGTILDTMGAWDSTGEKLLARFDKVPEENLHQILFPLTMEETAEYLIKNYQLPLSVGQVVHEINQIMIDYYTEEAQIKNDMMSLIVEFKKAGIPMAVATTTDRNAFMPAFERLGLTQYFDGIFTCSEVGYSKEHPHIFREALKLLKTPAENTYVFEDGLFSAQTASGEGLQIVGIYDESSADKWEDLKVLSKKYFDHEGILW